MANFRKKVVKATKLASLKFLSEIGLRLVSTVILTRLLAPEVYGVFALVLVYMYIFDMFSDIGLRSIVLTKEDKVEDGLLQSVWTISIMRGLLIGLAAAGLGGGIAILQVADFFAAQSPYANTTLPWALCGLGVASVIFGFQSPMRFVFERDMKFERVTIVDMATNIGSLIVTIALAYYFRSIWALVLGVMVKSTIHVVLSFVLFKGPGMRLRFDREEFWLVFGRGKWILGQSAMFALSQSADRLVLGFVLSSATFGFYYIAFQLIDMVAKFLGSVHRQVGVQVFTHLYNSSVEGFRRNYYRYRIFFDAMAGLSTGGMIVLSPVFVEIVFDDRYGGVASIVQVLAWSIPLIGPTLLRSAFDAERRFKRTMLLAMVSTVSIWSGLLVATLVFNSVEMALLVIALHRLPEAMIITVMAGDRDWIVVWREFIVFGFCAAGVLLAWPLRYIWEVML